MPTAWLSEVNCVALLGEERAGAFIRQFGGRERYIPRTPKKDHPIAKVIGVVGLSLLCAEYGGTTVSITSGRKGKKIHIIEFLEQGMSASCVAETLGVSMRYVQTLKRAINPAKTEKKKS